MSHLLSHGWLIFLLFCWVALSVGSFLNVAIYRLPVMLNREWRSQAREILEDSKDFSSNPVQEESETFNLMVPRSRCPDCAKPIKAWQNIPVLSWLLLRGRCAECGSPISARYPLVELFTLLCSLAVIALYGYTWLGLVVLFFTWWLITLSFIDFDTRLLPDSLTLPLLWGGLLLNTRHGITDLTSAVIGAVAGYLILWSIYWAFKLLTGKEGMGYGDFKLLAALGAWMGWQALPIVILVSSISGVVLGGGLMLFGIIQRTNPIPFGPFLAIAGWITLLWRDTLVHLL